MSNIEANEIAQIRADLLESSQVKVVVANTMADKIHQASMILIESLRGGGKVLLAGNGGSAADAQHIAAELVGRYMRDRSALPAIALTTDSSILTAVANDMDYDSVFSRQVEAFGQTGDVFVAISTSGNSKNIIKAAIRSRDRHLKTIGMTGQTGGKLASLVDLNLAIPSDSTPRIQEAHIAIGHVICNIVEKHFADE